MSRRLAPLLSLLLLTACVGSPSPAPDVADGGAETLWTVDLVRTLPGQQAEYMRSIEANWAGARRIARERGPVLSYRAFQAEPDSARGWDVILMTEYADSSAWAAREEVFQDIFADPAYVRTPTAVPSGELRDFVVSGLVMMAFVAEDGPSVTAR